MDERRAKGLAYCLSCGQPLAGFAATSAPPSLRPGTTQPPSQYGAPGSQVGPQYGGTPPPSQYGAPSQFGAAPGTYGTPPPGTMPAYPIQPQIQQQKGSGALGLIIGLVVGAGGLLAIVVAIIIVAVGRSSSSSSSSAASDGTPTSTVAIETPTTSASDDTKTAPTANGHHSKSTTSSTNETPPPTGPQPFPTTRAIEKLDEATAAAERLCPRSEGPFGSTLIEVTFEVDGRTGTLSHKPIGGTPEGDCITAEFLAIHLGPFEGARRTFSRSVTMRSPGGSTTPTATTSGHQNKPDAGRSSTTGF